MRNFLVQKSLVAGLAVAFVTSINLCNISSAVALKSHCVGKECDPSQHKKSNAQKTPSGHDHHSSSKQSHHHSSHSSKHTEKKHTEKGHSKSTGESSCCAKLNASLIDVKIKAEPVVGGFHASQIKYEVPFQEKRFLLDDFFFRGDLSPPSASFAPFTPHAPPLKTFA